MIVKYCAIKRITAFAAVMATLAAFFALMLTAWAAAPQETKMLSEFSLRDPFVLVYDGKYYLYGTGAASGLGYGCYTSDNLTDWSGPQNVFTAPADFDGVENFWAPECHYFNGSFYLFATYKSKANGHRGVSVFKSDRPDGGFAEISDGHVTPHDRDSIDGTLYVDKSGQPWMIYVDEWTGTEDGMGRIDAAKLSTDLSQFISKPIELFRADSALWSSSNVTDGPFLYNAADGSLLMLWSSFNKYGYCVGTARATDGAVDGKWRQDLYPLYQQGSSFALDGGHAMLFTALDGQLYMSLHSPNSSTPEQPTRVKLLKVSDNSGRLTLDDEQSADSFSSMINHFKLFFEYLFTRVDRIVNKMIGR